MICVYPADCADFSGNGLGVVQPQSCTVTETLNGEWELTLVHPIDEYGKWTRLSEGNILRAPVPAAMTPQMNLVTQQYQTQTYDVEIYTVTTQRDPLRLRSGTGTNYKVLAKYKKGTEVVLVSKPSSSWYEVTCPDGRHGYMSSEYLTHARTEQQSTQVNVGFQNQVIEPRQLRDQPFRIYRVVPDLTRVTVYARHIFYDLLDNMIRKLEPSSSAVGASVAQSISSACLSGHSFTFYSDLTSTAEDVCFENVNPVDALLGEGGLVDKYGAELARDWFDVFLVKRVGVNSDVQIREGKNLTGISYDVDATNVVTRIMPTGEDADGKILYLPELYIDSPNIGAYTHPKWVHLPVPEAKEVTEGDEQKSKDQCYTEMRNAAQTEYENGCDLPTVTLKVTLSTARMPRNTGSIVSPEHLPRRQRACGGPAHRCGSLAPHDAVHLRLPHAEVHRHDPGHGGGHPGRQHDLCPATGQRLHHRHEAGHGLRWRGTAAGPVRSAPCRCAWRPSPPRTSRMPASPEPKSPRRPWVN